MNNKTRAIQEVRKAAEFIIEQRERQAKGWDKGAFRDDDTRRTITIEAEVEAISQWCFDVSAMFKE